MSTHAIPRLLLVGCLFAFIVTGAVHSKAAAKAGTMDWSETVSGEEEFVQACNGFDITSSYTSNRAFHVVENYSGDWVVERLNISFAGSLANAKNGSSLPYDGKFTRTTYSHLGRVTVSDLELRIGLPTPGDFTLKIARQEMDLASNPVDVIHAFAQRELESGICVLLGRSFPANVPARGLTDFLDTLHMTQDQPVEATHDMTPWTELDPCDTVPPGQHCSH
jgi:hypothetical protein